MLPPLRAAADADLYAAEPYVMPGNIDGPDSPYAGRAGWTWYTGSAAWMRRVIQYL
jgi:cellobiose phosphorylase